MNTTRGRMVGGWTNETTRLESSQPRHPGAYRRLWAAPYPTATHEKERERSQVEGARERGGGEGRDGAHEEDRAIPRDEGRRRERRFTQPSSSENPRREAHCRCADKPRILLARASFSRSFSEELRNLSFYPVKFPSPFSLSLSLPPLLHRSLSLSPC